MQKGGELHGQEEKKGRQAEEEVQPPPAPLTKKITPVIIGVVFYFKKI